MSNKNRILFNVFTMHGDEVYRIIGSRELFKNKEELYRRY